MELTRSIEVGSGGRIELVFPELQQGQRVEVHVLITEAVLLPHAGFGSHKGLIRIKDNFDDPLPEFADYM